MTGTHAACLTQNIRRSERGQTTLFGNRIRHRTSTISGTQCPASSSGSSHSITNMMKHGSLRIHFLCAPHLPRRWPLCGDLRPQHRHCQPAAALPGSDTSSLVSAATASGSAVPLTRDFVPLAAAVETACLPAMERGAQREATGRHAARGRDCAERFAHVAQRLWLEADDGGPQRLTGRSCACIEHT